MEHDRRVHAVVFNAIQPALAQTGDWVRLQVRQNVADAVLEALTKHGLAVVPAEAALSAALNDPAAVPERAEREERCPCHGWRKVESGEADRAE